MAATGSVAANRHYSYRTGGVMFPCPGADGTTLYAASFGEGPHLVLLHGGGPDHRSLLPLGRRLADRYTVVLPDVRGYGRSVCTDPTRHTWRW